MVNNRFSPVSLSFSLCSVPCSKEVLLRIGPVSWCFSFSRSSCSRSSCSSCVLFFSLLLLLLLLLLFYYFSNFLEDFNHCGMGLAVGNALCCTAYYIFSKWKDSWVKCLAANFLIMSFFVFSLQDGDHNGYEVSCWFILLTQQEDWR